MYVRKIFGTKMRINPMIIRASTIMVTVLESKIVNVR